MGFVKSEAAIVPLQSSIARQHHHNKSNTDRSSIRSTTTRWRWSKQHQQPLVQCLPALLQRPQHFPAAPKPIAPRHIHLPPKTNDHDDNNNNEDDGGGGGSSSSSRGSSQSASKKATAIDVLHLMDSLRFPVESDMYVSFLKECTHSRDAVQGAMVHAHIQEKKRKKSIGSLVSLANHLLLMYTACRRPDAARQLFDRMPIRDFSSWATMISALSDSGDHREALQLLVDMVEAQGWLVVEPTTTLALLLTVVLRSCVRVRELRLGQQLHALTSKMETTDTCGSLLLHFYAMLGCQESARKLFDKMPPSSREAAAAWTHIISSYCRQGQFQEAFRVFREMIKERRAGNNKKKNDSFAFASILTACARKGDEQGWGGRQVHARAIKIGLDSDRFVGSSLVDMYGRFGLLSDARRAFETVGNSSSIRDADCWNAMLSGYVRSGCYAEAIRFLYEMKAAGIEPQEYIACQVRIACGS